MNTPDPTVAPLPTFEPRHVTLTSHTPDTGSRSEANFDLPQPASVPCLRVAGKWLRNAGFDDGMKVRIEVSHGRLIIEPVPPPRSAT